MYCKHSSCSITRRTHFPAYTVWSTSLFTPQRENKAAFAAAIGRPRLVWRFFFYWMAASIFLLRGKWKKKKTENFDEKSSAQLSQLTNDKKSRRSLRWQDLTVINRTRISRNDIFISFSWCAQTAWNWHLSAVFFFFFFHVVMARSHAFQDRV